jgi:4-diphosphocytidyl-2-C-methyl-D-erythritol kinase
MSSHSSTRWPAPAKLNLFLHVTGQRPDGYHQLQTIFQLLDWGDEIFISPNTDGSINRSNQIEGIPEDGADIRLVKNIPTGSGLGGGSSDAATVLHALNYLWGCGFSIQQLAELGLKLGADVPVFVHGHSAWAEGVGDQLQTFELGETWYVLVHPEQSISTAEIFNHPDLPRDSIRIDRDEYDFFKTGNDCEAVALNLFPELKKIIQELSQWGSPRLTGTGSGIFLPINEKNDAISITNELKSRYNVRAVRGVDHSPLLAKLSVEH